MNLTICNKEIASEDEALMARLQSGDTEALSCLFRLYAPLVRSIAYRILRDRSEADDLLQDIFLRVYKTALIFDPAKGSVRTWILQMAYHRSISRRRYLNTRHFYTRLDVQDLQLTDSRNVPEILDRVLDSAVLNAPLQELMAALSDNQQKTLRLYFFEGYTLDEIAVELGQRRENIKQHYFRGLNKLRRQLFGSQKLRKPRVLLVCNRALAQCGEPASTPFCEKQLRNPV